MFDKNKWVTCSTFIKQHCNKIESMYIQQHTRLTSLQLDKNNVGYPSALSKVNLTHLLFLNLGGNYLLTVPDLSVFMDLSSLQQLDLSENHFVCNCDVLIFRDWLQNTKH